MQPNSSLSAHVDDTLAMLGIVLPPSAPTPAGSYVPASVVTDMVMTSGQLPIIDGALIATGKVGEEVSPDEAYRCARQCAINALAAIRNVAGSLDAVDRVVKVTGFVASAPSFTGQATVLNGASDLLTAVFGERGVHVRSAVGVAVLPLDSPVEVEVTVTLR